MNEPTLAEIMRRVEVCEKDIEHIREKEIPRIKEKQNDYAVEQAKVNAKLDNVLIALGGVKSDLDAIKNRPRQWWDKVITAVITALVAGFLGYLFGGKI